jgi:hypothetical protein
VVRERSDALPTHAVSLTPLGTAVLRNSQSTNGEARRGRTVRLPGAYFLKHLVEVNDFRIALETDARQRQDLELLGVLADTDRATGRGGNSAAGRAL